MRNKQTLFTYKLYLNYVQTKQCKIKLYSFSGSETDLKLARNVADRTHVKRLTSVRQNKNRYEVICKLGISTNKDAC